MKIEASNEYLLVPGSLWEGIAYNAIDRIRSLDRSRKWNIEIKLYRARRSDQQNKYLWGVVYKILQDETGNDPELLHEFFLGEYFGWEERDVMGNKRLVPKLRSKNLPTLQFFEYVEFIRGRASALGYYIPDPNPYWQTALGMDKRAA